MVRKESRSYVRILGFLWKLMACGLEAGEKGAVLERGQKHSGSNKEAKQGNLKGERSNFGRKVENKKKGWPSRKQGGHFSHKGVGARAGKKEISVQVVKGKCFKTLKSQSQGKGKGL